MKNILIIITALFISKVAQAQNVELIDNEVRTTTYQNKSYLVLKSLTIKAPVNGQFKVSASTDGPFFIRIAEDAKLLSNTPPSLDKNFVREEAILKQGITQENQISNLPVQERSINFRYLDGMGREMENVKVKASPNENDVITAGYFDNMGNKTLGYLPYTNSQKNGGFRASYDSETKAFYSSTPQVATESSRPFAETKYEASSLSRVSEVFGPGSAWSAKSKKSKTLIDASGSIRKWTYVDDNNPPTIGLYDSLTVVESIDEDNHAKREFADERGLIVLKQVQVAGDYINSPGGVTWLDTYYVYDDFGRIKVVVPPEASARVATEYVTNNDVKNSFLNRWCFQYRHDDLGNVIAKRVPGWTTWEYTIYDKWNRTVLTQNPAQGERNEWTFTKYDRFNRGIMTGLWTTSSSIQSLRTSATASTSRFEVANTSSEGYSISSTYPTTVSASNLISITYYDNYDFLGNYEWELPAGSNSNYDAVNVSGFLPSSQFLTNVTGKVTGTKVRVLKGNNNWLNSVTRYDNKYRPVQVITENNVGGRDRISTAYDFAGRVLKTEIYHTSSVITLNTLREFEIDHAGRVLKLYQTIDNGPRVLMASNKYNEVGQLIEKNIHSTDNGGTFLQSIDQRYNIRGWITSINNSSLSNDGIVNNDANDLFGIELLYNPTTKPMVNGFPTSDDYIHQFYNGNISAIKWKTDIKKGIPEEKIYAFDYDASNRLKGAYYAVNNAGAWSTNVGLFNEIAKGYDKNGNIQGIERYGKVGGTSSLIDNTTHIYNYQGTTIPNFIGESNRLIKVQDNGGTTYGFNDGANASEEFRYDASGNLIYDLNKQISNVSYNHFNLPEVIEFTRQSGNIDRIRYQYDATGTKLSTTVYKDGNSSSDGTLVWTTEYVGDLQYDKAQGESFRKLSFVSTPEGRAVKNDTGFDYEYFYKDHQNNVRLTYGLLKETVSYRASMEDPASSTLGGEEETIFRNINETRYQNAGGENFNYTKSSDLTLTPDRSAQTNGYIPNKSVGPAKKLDVMAGDKIKIGVFATYKYTTGSSSLIASTALISAVTGTFNITSTENPALYSGFSNNVPIVPGSGSGSSTLPKAYLAYLFFSESQALVTSAAIPITTSAHDAFEKLEQTFTAPQNGFLYIYVCNESSVNAINGSVYFDEMTIVHQKNNNLLQVTQASDYYPFGLTFNTYQSDRISESFAGVQKNRYGFQGQELQKDLDLGWSQFKWRMHDPSIGRFVSVDPLAEKYFYNSTFAFSENKLTSHIELEGLESFDFRFLGDLLNWMGLNPWNNPETPSQAAQYEHNRQRWNTLAREPIHELRDAQRQAFDVVPVVGPMTNAVIDGKSGIKTGNEIATDLTIEAGLEFLPLSRYLKSFGGQAMEYILKKTDVDFRGTGILFQEALETAFKKTGLSREDFEVTKWAKTKDGKDIPVEYRAEGGAEISIDYGHKNEGLSPDVPHIGWQTTGKKDQVRGHIILDEVPAGRSNNKEYTRQY